MMSCGVGVGGVAIRAAAAAPGDLHLGVVVAALRKHPFSSSSASSSSSSSASVPGASPNNEPWVPQRSHRKIFTSASGAAAAARKVANPGHDLERPFFNVAQQFGIASRRSESTPRQRQLAQLEPLKPGLGSFRFPSAASSSSSSGEEAASESLRALAAAHRDPALAHELGARFAKQALSKFNSPLHKHGTLDPLISEFSIGSPEGVALLQLAEALIRLPPEARGMPATLVRDKLARGDLDFFSHFAGDKSVLVNGASLAVGAVQRILRGDVLPPLSAAVSGSGVLEMGIRRGLGIMGKKFILGNTVESAAARAIRNEASRPLTSHSFDMLGEGARTAEDADRYLRSYLHAARHLGGPDTAAIREPQMSVKLSSLCPRFDELSRATALPVLTQALGELVQAGGSGPGAGANGVTIFVDGEEQSRLELTLAVLEATVRVHKPAAIGIAVQAYGRRAMHALEFLEELARAHPGTNIKVRLVKGAYWDGEIKEAQVQGADAYPVWTDKRATDVSYLACAAFLLNSSWLRGPAFATHNTRTVADILAMTGGLPDFVEAGCEFQRLHGMGESFDYAGAPLRVYAPTGTTNDLLAYLVRRLLENGANSSFLKQLADGREHLLNLDVLAAPASSSSDLGAGVMTAEQACAILDASSGTPGTPGTSSSSGLSGARHMSTSLAPAMSTVPPPLRSTNISPGLPSHPRAIYSSRLGARGVDFESPDFPALFAGTRAYAPAAGASASSTVEQVLERLALNSDKFGGGLGALGGVAARAGVLRGAADLIEAEALPMAKLVMEEAGKTVVDAINEVRELVDFFRFYAAQAEDTLVERRLKTVTGEENVIVPMPRGNWLCVGPFNFPLAIVGGLASAAFVAGNPVVVKPHPATPRCAAALVDVLRCAGMPEDAMTVVLDEATAGGVNNAVAPGSGSSAGAQLVGSGAFAGVSFVGSTQTAAAINYSLAVASMEKGAPLARLVAETGGLNVLVADASALPEQVCDAVIASFAGAAGQRCSSARVLVLDRGCKTSVMRLLAGGLAELRVGDPLDVATDVGPLISAAAAGKAREHCARLEADGATLACSSARGAGADTGGLDELDTVASVEALVARRAEMGAYASAALFHPRVYELPGGAAGLELLAGEVFAPVLHVVEYDGSPENLAEVLAAVNKKGFALTGGVLTRCESVKALVKERLNCGNLYMNRDIVGAVVESQPFGGHGLSGNGTKAGGEGYLLQFVSHKVVSEDTTASGGNMDLLRTT